MRYKKIILSTALIVLMQCNFVSAATVYGTYSVEATAVLVGGQGIAYNGTDWFRGAGTSWERYNAGWQPSAAPTGLNDASVSTLLAGMPTHGSLNLNLGFNNTHVVNGTGSDLAFFFLWDQSANSANVTINGITRDLSFQNLYNVNGVQQVANNVIWGGTTRSNVLVMVGEIDLSNFGLLNGAALMAPLSISLTSNGSAQTGVPMALSMVGALHTGTGVVVPLPAPFILLISGLAALGFVSRRK